MRTLLALTFLIAFAGTSAHAQGNKIIVIDEFGKVSEVDIGESPSPAAPKAKEKPVAPPSLRRTVPAAPEPAPTPEKETVKKETAKKEVTPVKKPAAPAPKKKKEAKQNTEKKTKQKQAAPVKSAPAQPYVSPRPQRLGPQMTPEDAIRIALDVAPPAITVNASPVNYKGLHAYEVVFKTENGNQFVYVDRDTGKIVK